MQKSTTRVRSGTVLGVADGAPPGRRCLNHLQLRVARGPQATRGGAPHLSPFAHILRAPRAR